MNLATRKLIVAVSAAVFAATVQAQTPSPAPASSQAPAQAPPQAPAQVQTQTQPTNANGSYIAIDPLAGVKYDNRWDVSVGLASGHIHAGPNLREGADLGGLDISGSYWLTKHFGLEASWT